MTPTLEGLLGAYRQGELGPRRIRLDHDAIDRMGPAEQGQVRELLANWDELRRARPLDFYEPAGPKHVAVHHSAKRIRAVFGGNRAGKSTISQIDTVIQAAPASLVPDHVQWIKRHNCEIDGPYYARTVVNDMKRTGEVIRQKWREWVPKDLLRQRSFDKAYDKNTDQLRLECGCMFELLSTEMDLDKHGGHARHRIIYDEEPPEEYRTENVQRLADFGGDEFFAMTPLKGLSWAYHVLWKNRGSEYVDAWKIGMRDNKNLTKADVDFVLSQIRNEAERRQREFGEFAERGGQIYPNFLDGRVKAPTISHVGGLDIVVGIDPGIRYAGIVFVAFDRDDVALVFSTLLLRNADAEDMAKAIWATLDAWELPRAGVDYIIDPSARNRTAVNAESMEGALAELGIYTQHGQNDVQRGIAEVQLRLKQRAVLVSDQLHGLGDEAIEYAWEEREDGLAIPVKKNDHRLDALRYVLMSRPWSRLDIVHESRSPFGSDVATGPPRPVDREGEPDSAMGALA